MKLENIKFAKARGGYGCRNLPGIIAVLAFLAGPGTRCVPAQGHPSILELFQKLESDETAHDFVDQVRDLGGSDTAARKYLVDHLPALIEAGPRSYHPSDPPDATVQFLNPAWLYAVSVADDLKMVECASALAKLISVRTSPITGLSTEARLEYSPAGTALIHIGDPAIPALRALLEKGNLRERWDSVHALLRIDSPKATAVLRDYVSHGSDESLRQFIERALAK